MSITSNLTIAVLLFSGCILPLQGAVNFVPGDLLVGFQATGGIGAGSTYVYNAGPAANLRDYPSPGAIANLATDLSATFGPNWYARTDLYWAAGGVRDNAAFGPTASAVVNGDAARTIYASKETVAPGTSSPHANFTAPTVNTTATRMIDSQLGFTTTNGTTPRDATAGSSGNGVVQGINDINSWSSRVPVLTAPWTTMPLTVQGNFGTSNSLTYLDLYRAMSDNSGLPGVVEPTATGVFVYQSTLSIDPAGTISAVPEPKGVLLALGGLMVLLRRSRVTSPA